MEGWTTEREWEDVRVETLEEIRTFVKDYTPPAGMVAVTVVGVDGYLTLAASTSQIEEQIATLMGDPPEWEEGYTYGIGVGYALPEWLENLGEFTGF